MAGLALIAALVATDAQAHNGPRTPRSDGSQDKFLTIGVTVDGTTVVAGVYCVFTYGVSSSNLCKP